MPQPDLILHFVVLAGLGLLLGSFLGVIVHRGPIIWGLSEENAEAEGLSLAWPPSHCPTCKRHLSAAELIPILGFFLSRGRCKSCKAPIPKFYPVIESLGLMAGVLAALLFSAWLAAIGALLFFLFLIALSFIDQRTGYLPDALTLPLATIGLLAGGLGLYVSVQAAIWGWAIGWGGLATLGMLYRMVRGRDGLGGGDAKLLGAGAAFTGPYLLPVILLLAAGSALIAALVQEKGQLSGQKEIRFGPWLAGAIAIIFIARSIWQGILFPAAGL